MLSERLRKQLEQLQRAVATDASPDRAVYTATSPVRLRIFGDTNSDEAALDEATRHAATRHATTQDLIARNEEAPDRTARSTSDHGLPVHVASDHVASDQEAPNQATPALNETPSAVQGVATPIMPVLNSFVTPFAAAREALFARSLAASIRERWTAWAEIRETESLDDSLHRNDSPDANPCVERNETSQADKPSESCSSFPSTLFQNGMEVETEWGTHWLVRQTLDQTWPASKRYLSEDGTLRALPQWQANRSPSNDPANTTADAPATPAETSSLWSSLRTLFPQRTLFLDLETCGLAGSSIFLIGLIHLHEGQLTISQLWARHYGEEKAILQTLLQLASECHTLVTFNGKSFDWPQICDRCTLHHLPVPKREPPKVKPQPKKRRGSRTASKRKLARSQDSVVSEIAERGEDAPPEQASQELSTPNITGPSFATLNDDEWFHFDLLHASRKRWRGQVPNCRLQTLERLICGRHRVGDIPGREIPQAYHDYVRHGRLDQVPSILHHNALDLVTLLQLMLVFLNEAGGEAGSCDD